MSAPVTIVAAVDTKARGIRTVRSIGCFKVDDRFRSCSASSLWGVCLELGANQPGLLAVLAIASCAFADAPLAAVGLAFVAVGVDVSVDALIDRVVGIESVVALHANCASNLALVKSLSGAIEDELVVLGVFEVCDTNIDGGDGDLEAGSVLLKSSDATFEIVSIGLNGGESSVELLSLAFVAPESSIDSVNLTLQDIDISGQVSVVSLNTSQANIDLIGFLAECIDLGLKADGSGLLCVHFTLQSLSVSLKHPDSVDPLLGTVNTVGHDPVFNVRDSVIEEVNLSMKVICVLVDHGDITLDHGGVGLKLNNAVAERMSLIFAPTEVALNRGDLRV
jgi:hypothetical protein